MVKSKVASIRALQELKEIVQGRYSAKYTPLCRTAENKCTKAKEEVSKKIEKEIEAFAVEKYKEYGLEVVPVCRRSSSYKDSDIVRPELRIRAFDRTAENEYQKVKDEMAAAQQKIEDWYFQSVQAVASQVDLPATPEF